MLRCQNFERYQAIYPPKCDGGRGCEACKAKWQAIARAKARKQERMNKPSKLIVR
jgi:hypothetical protein